MTKKSDTCFFSDGQTEDTPEQMIKRKVDHIRLCKTEDVESVGIPFSGLELIPEALPNLNFSDIELQQTFLGKTFSLPLLITGMTGGVTEGQNINETIATAAEKFRIPMGLGSQKMMIKDPRFKSLFRTRHVAPHAFVIGNLGAVSLNDGITVDDIRAVVDDFELSAFALHLNALQECIQPEGERNFFGLLPKIEALARLLPVPLIVKEVGSGISAATFERLVSAGVAAVDVGGRGGTSWSVIEGMRSGPERKRLGELFRNWGMPTDEALLACASYRKNSVNAQEVSLIATGGIRDGVQVAKAVAAGATMVGVGLPFFRAVAFPPSGQTPLEALESEISFFQQSLSIAMFCSGVGKLSDLAGRLVPIQTGAASFYKRGK